MTERTDAPAAWSALLADAVARSGLISEAYSQFWNYSVGNQFLALWQCMLRNLPPGPINTFLKWKDLGRQVKKGEKAITLCMPVTINTKKKVVDDSRDAGDESKRTVFVYRSHWFVLSQTDGKPYEPQELPAWSEVRALDSLSITRIAFTHLDGNAQGFARDRSVSVSPIAFAPHRTLLHELAHVVLGHTAEGEMTDDERTSRNIREVEAEGVALICCESLGLSGADHSRGYLQHWLRNDVISDRSAQRIFKAADAILRAGRPEPPPCEAQA
jgi:antirestriction protein ArdC